MKVLDYPSFFFFFALCAFPLLLTGQTAGTPDPDFGQGGEVVITDSSKTYYGGYTVLLPDGKMIVAGNEYEQPGADGIPVLTRLLPDGSIDSNYGINGQVRPEISSNGANIGKIALDAEGKLIVVGEILNTFFQKAFVARLAADGQLDTSFGQGGVMVLTIASSDVLLSTILLKSDGRILLGGAAYELGNAEVYNFLLIQLLPNGTLDPAFGTAGIAMANFTQGYENILSLALQADGKIVAAGGNATNNYDMEIVRFHPNGNIDQSFGTAGAFTFNLGTRDDVAYAVAIQSDQKIVFCGTSFQNGDTIGAITLFRINPDGSFDATFGMDGKVFTDLGFSELAWALVLQPDGKILVGAEGTLSSTNFEEGQFWVLRYNTDGSLDTTFGDNGKVQSPLYGQFAETTGLLLQPDGKIIHTGMANNQLVLWRYLNDIMVNVQETLLTDFHLQCSPNPVAESTNISWTLEQSAEVRGDLYNAQGRLVQTIIPPAFLPAGAQQQTIHFTHEIPAGTYFLVLQVGRQRQVISLIK